MNKMRVLLVGATAAGAFAAASFMPAQADDQGGVPGVFHIEADGDPTGPSGHIVVQGESSDIPSVGTGYIGVQGDSDGVDVVGCADGTYETDNEENAPNVIISIPGDVDPGFDPTPGDGPCTPAPPA